MHHASSSLQTPEPWRATRSRSRTGAPRILVAEDESELRELAAAALRECGYDVIEVGDGGRLLVCIASSYGQGGRDVACDLLVTDMRMPVCSGLAIVEGLRQAHWTIPVILMTAFGTRSIRARAKALDAVILDKPFGFHDLQTTVKRLLPG